MKVFAVLLTACLLAGGCKDSGPQISDEELADAIHECRSNANQSPSFAIRCDNYRRQCDERREEGRYVC